MKKFILLFIIKSCFGSFYKDHARGWFWYEDPRKQEDQMIQKNDKEPNSKPKTAKEQLDIYKKNLEETKAVALMDPSYNNVKNYMFAQKEMMDRSERFSHMWGQVVLQTPQLNHEIKFPTAQYMRHVYDDQHSKQDEDLLKRASKNFGLFFFVSPGCAFCKAFAPIVKAFADQYGFNVKVVSIQGRVHEDISTQFPDVVMNNGMAEAFGIEQAPALMAYDAQNQNVVPVTYGATSMDVLKNNFVTLLKG
ncbi:MAG: hypothetical protein CNLJKLNK_01278 [Holosporales bacterium]